MNKPELSIVKIGGRVLDDAAACENFLSAFSGISGKKILVHGGGKAASALSRRLGMEPLMQDGRRITDLATLEVVTMVYAGLINKQIVAALNARACLSFGMCGADGHTVPAKKRKHPQIDFGFVGDVEQDKIQVSAVCSLLQFFDCLVVAPVTSDGSGQLLNTNADTMAASLAIALSNYFSVKLVFCFEKAGVLSDITDDNSVLDVMTADLIAEMKSSGKIHSGMMPKIDNALSAVSSGVEVVKIGSAKEINRLIKKNHEAGTRIVV